MSNFTKVRNIISISIDGVNGDYSLDLNTGIYYGVRGTPIKTCPNKREVYSIFHYNNGHPNLCRAIRHMLNNTTRTEEFAHYVPTLQAAEKVDALGVCLNYFDPSHYAYLASNIKSLSAYLKETDKERFNFGLFQRWCEFEKVKSSTNVANLLTEEQYYALARHLHNITAEEMGVCAYYLNKCKMWEYHCGNVVNLSKYIQYCRIMGVAPQKVNGFMREFVETQKTYELQKEQFDDKRLVLNYEGHAKAWEFEYGDFKVFIPSCGQDIVREGQRMHHCVGSYVNRVVEGETYICFIRRKNTPDDCYITCQVATDGEIGQYFLAYDRYISTAEDKAFKVAFQAHLMNVWGV